MNIRKMLASAATTALMFGSMVAPALAAVTNGSFETGTAPGAFTQLNAVNNTDIANWSVDSGSVDYIGTYWTASEGGRSIDLSGVDAGTMSQVVPTVIGLTYTVTFDLSGNPEGGPSVKEVMVSATGGAPQSFTYDTAAKGNTLGDMKWEEMSYSFTATSVNTTLTFASTIATAYGPALDNVVINDGLLCAAPVSQTLVSDTSTTLTAGNAVAVALPVHVGWTAVIPGATWIWEPLPTDPNETVVFEKQFTVTGAVLSAILDVASDNSYVVKIDGVTVASDANLDNFTLASQDTHNLTANVAALAPGVHTLSIEVNNLGAFDAASNPAGLLYRFVVETQVCVEPASVSGYKFWDINGNTTWDIGEPGLSGWTFNLAGPTAGSQVTGAGGAYSFTGLVAGSYTMTENGQAGWTQTTPNPSFELTAGEDKTGVNIGNACFVSTGGKSKGYWTNKNGEATLNDSATMAPELALLAGLNLRNETGAHFNPANYAAFKTWVGKESNAKNMAYMLSAQLAAVELSVEAGVTSGSAIVVATNPLLVGITSSLGLISISDLMNAADTSLSSYGLTPSGHAQRAYQEALKNVLDRVANGQNIQVCASWDVSGTYVVDVEYLGINYPETLILTQSGTAITGVSLDTIPPASFFAIISGSVIGNAVSIRAQQGSLFVNLVGTIAPDGSMSGSWADESPGTRTGTWATTSGAATWVY